MSKPHYLSREAIEALQAELHHLKFVRRPEISQAIQTARQHGDLAENAEFDVAREEQQHLERRILQIESTLATARPLEDADIATDACYLGATVTLQDLEDGSEEVYLLVAPPEADPRRGKLSVESPIGRGLLGRKPGEEVAIAIPAGSVRYRILKVAR
jgi:transcription elongation factor GreA